MFLSGAVMDLLFFSTDYFGRFAYRKELASKTLHSLPDYTGIRVSEHSVVVLILQCLAN
jgi:hypothetical protein